jgi:hypothetical protein
MSGSKRCTTCNQTLSLDLFHKDSRAKDGHRSRCSSCVSRRAREDSKRPPVIEDDVTHAVCGRCERLGRESLLPLSDFGVARRRKSGRNSWCRRCCSDATCEWQRTEGGRKKHIEAVKRYNEKRRLERGATGS